MVSKQYIPMTATKSLTSSAPWTFGPLRLRKPRHSSNMRFCPHPMWLGSLPVSLAEHHHGKVRRLRLVLATITHLTKAEITSLLEGPYLPGGTVLHNLVYGYAADASLEPEWLVITDGQQPGRWRLLHNSSGPGQRCSVGSSLRYQPNQAHVNCAVRRIIPLKHCTGCTSMTRGECSQSLMPLNPTLSCHRNQAL